MASFTIEDCEFDFGQFSLGGDWLIEIGTDDGHTFAVTAVTSCQQSLSGAVVDLIKEWVAGDLARADRKSRVRAAYEEQAWLLDLPGAIAASRADDLRDQRMNAEAA
jgi:hypothetical protein